MPQTRNTFFRSFTDWLSFRSLGIRTDVVLGPRRVVSGYAFLFHTLVSFCHEYLGLFSQGEDCIVLWVSVFFTIRISSIHLFP